MEIIEGIAKLIGEYGLPTISLIALVVLIYKKWDYIVTTLQAAAIVKEQQKTISALKETMDSNNAKHAFQIDELNSKLEINNKLILEQSVIIATLTARLERYEEVITKKIASSPRRPKKAL